MARRQGYEFVAARIEERIGAHRERGDALLRDSFEDRLDLAVPVCVPSRFRCYRV
jgi:hypothetical protein